jgi:Domain of unknown function (DUF4157)
MTRVSVQTRRDQPRRPDPAEAQAERAAETVARGGRVAGWRFEAPNTSDPSADLGDPSADLSDSSAGGRPLGEGVRTEMEARFGQDFTGVRLHDDSAAQHAAASLSAQAFTVGEDISLGSGHPDVDGAGGTHLLAHELAHVVQQRAAGVGPPQLRSAWDKFTIWLGTSEGTWSDKELTAYVTEITKADTFSGAYDADNLARAVVAKWKSATPGFELTGRQKVLLIQEMLDGPTLDDDENAILDLLTKSDAGDLREIMRAVEVSQLRSNLHGEESDRLDTFLDARFVGGRTGLKSGAVVKGAPVPTGAPTPRFSIASMERWFSSDRTPEEIAALISTMSAADQKDARHYLVNTRRHQQNIEVERVEAAGPVQTPWRSNPDALAARKVQLRTERVLLLLFNDQLPKDETALLAGTSAIPSPLRAQQMQDLLSRPTGTFTATLPGESNSYEQKLAAKLPEIVGVYYDMLVTKAPPRSNTLANLEKLGVVAKDETDKVFGAFYGGKTHPSYVADTVDATGKVITKGTLHDQWETKQQMLNIGTATQLKGAAHNMMRAILTRNIWVRGLNDAHGSQPEFDAARDPANDVAKIQVKVTEAFLAASPTNVTMVTQIWRGWPGAAIDQDIFLQIGQSTDPTEARIQMWENFQTFIHEYVHTLVHPAYNTYAESFGFRSPKHNALMEGVDCVLEEMVWERIVPLVADPNFRAKVEGPDNAKKPAISVPHSGLLRGYPSYTEALKLIEMAGLNNVLAAYFLGKVELIGGPIPGAGSGSTP